MPESFSETAELRCGNARTLIGGLAYSLRLAIAAAHLCVMENFLHELQENMRAEHTLDVLRECLPAADSPRERRTAQAVAMLKAGEVTA